MNSKDQNRNRELIEQLAKTDVGAFALHHTYHSSYSSLSRRINKLHYLADSNSDYVLRADIQSVLHIHEHTQDYIQIYRCEYNTGISAILSTTKRSTMARPSGYNVPERSAICTAPTPRVLGLWGNPKQFFVSNMLHAHQEYRYQRLDHQSSRLSTKCLLAAPNVARCVSNFLQLGLQEAKVAMQRDDTSSPQYDRYTATFFNPSNDNNDSQRVKATSLAATLRQIVAACQKKEVNHRNDNLSFSSSSDNDQHLNENNAIIVPVVIDSQVVNFPENANEKAPNQNDSLIPDIDFILHALILLASSLRHTSAYVQLHIVVDADTPKHVVLRNLLGPLRHIRACLHLYDTRSSSFFEADLAPLPRHARVAALVAAFLKDPSMRSVNRTLQVPLDTTFQRNPFQTQLPKNMDVMLFQSFPTVRLNPTFFFFRHDLSNIVIHNHSKFWIMIMFVLCLHTK